MSELRRILKNRRRLALLLALPILAAALFVLERMGGDIRLGVSYLAEETAQYRADKQRFAAMTPEEAEADRSEYYMFDGQDQVTLRSTMLHVAGYRDYLDNVKKQAERMSNSAIFGKNKNTFTYRNIQKTAKDFEKLEGVTPEFGGNRAVETWLGFRLADAFYLIAMLILVLAFFEEKRCGILPLVRSTPAGRKRLALRRLGVLFLWACAFTLLLYAGTLAVSFALYGGTETLSHAVQSIQGFKTCTLRVSVGEWIALYFVAKALCGFLLGLIFWFILSFLSQTQLSWIVIIAILGAEYAAWAFIPTQMALSVFRWVNVFSYVFPADALGKYVNMNFFGLPVGVLDLLVGLYIVLAVLLSVGVVLVSVKRRPVGNRDLLGRLVAVYNRGADALRSRLSVTGMEWYKQLIFGGTVLFIIAAALIAPKLNYMGYGKSSPDDFLYSQYLREAQGPINEETYAYVEKARANVEDREGLGDFESAIGKLELRIKEAVRRAEEGGYEAWLMDQSRLSEVIGEDSVSVHRWNAIVAAALAILIAAPLFTVEKSCGTDKLLRSTARGRGGVFARKYLVLLVEIVAVFAILYTRQWMREVRLLGPDMLGAPIRNADMFAGTRLDLSLGGLMGAVFALRLVSLIAVGLIAAFVSARSQTREKAALVCAALMLVPGAVLYFGSEWAGYLSVIPGISAVDVLVPSAHSAGFAIVTSAVLAAAVALTVWEKRRQA